MNRRRRLTKRERKALKDPRSNPPVQQTNRRASADVVRSWAGYVREHRVTLAEMSGPGCPVQHVDGETLDECVERHAAWLDAIALKVEFGGVAKGNIDQRRQGLGLAKTATISAHFEAE